MHPTAATANPRQNHLESLRSCLALAARTLDLIGDNLDSTPFLSQISVLVGGILGCTKRLGRHPGRNMQMLQGIYTIVDQIILLHMDTETCAFISPGMLSAMATFVTTLQKTHNYFQLRSSASRVARIFRQNEVDSLRRGCETGLKSACEAFQLHGIRIASHVLELNALAEDRHREVLGLIQAGSETSSLFSSQSRNVLSGVHGSSSSLCMLPSQPKIFHGRETELNTILTLFQQSSPRIAILGPGGMGKTSLAKVVLHHPIIAGLFASSIYFISCESASTVDELATQIALHMNNSVHIDSHSNPRVQLQQQVSLMDRCLLVLDNLETLWEPAETRSDLEEFLSGLSSNLQLAIMITMRGTERPGRVLWSRPFLQPLTPLSDLAARQTFMDIADSESIQDEDALRRLLEISEKMPLAITLLAHLADAEGCEAVTRQWESEKTSLISKGSSKYWNLEFSISLSLSSPRITPGAVELLRLLSILPDGLSDGELRSINLPMAEKSALVRTSLAYVDDNRKLKVLAPIREYMVRLHPPPKELICVLFAYYAELLEMGKLQRMSNFDLTLIPRVRASTSNIQVILERTLDNGPGDINNVDMVYLILALDTHSKRAGNGLSPLLKRIPELMPSPVDDRLEAFYAVHTLESSWFDAFENRHLVVTKITDHLSRVDDSELQANFYASLAGRYRTADLILEAQDIVEKGLSLCTDTSTAGYMGLLIERAWMQETFGDMSSALKTARKAQRLAKLTGRMILEVEALRVVISCETVLGNNASAVALCKEGRNLLKLCGMAGSHFDYHLMGAQGQSHCVNTEYREARDVYTQILDSISARTEPHQFGFVLLNLCEIDLLVNAPIASVRERLGEARGMLLKVDSHRLVAFCDCFEADLQRREGHLALALAQYEQRFNQARGKDAELESYCLERLARSSTLHHLQWPTLFLAHSVRHQRKLDILKALQRFAEIFYAMGDVLTAKKLFSTSLDGFSAMGVHRFRADCLLHLGDIAASKDDTTEAASLWSEAKPLFERSAQEQCVLDVTERLDSVRSRLLSSPLLP